MRKLASVFALGACALLLAASGVSAESPKSNSSLIVAIYQSNHITEHQRFTVSVQVASTTGISYAYFNFCQLTSPVCYRPVAMTLHAPNWYVGTTNPMSSYYQMVPGSRAGYNITIVYTDNHNITVPAFPNAFSNLTVATEVGSGWFMFAMSVSNLTFNLTGVVQDSTTSGVLAAAHLTLNAQNGSTTTAVTSGEGAYTFGAVQNGTYRLEVAHPGYKTTNQTVVVDGRDTVQNVPLTNASAPAGKKTSGGGGLSGFLTNSFAGVPGWAIVAALLVVVVALVAVALMRKRRRFGATGRSESSGATTPPSGPPT
ncbi:MAG: carboxypeptidase-like regulatory domain-containing protein [Thermoplasmata archaeon]|nr:carboxypeptidase-like regulatory domain-containing protein [Thermoplasmata archaeon]